MWDWVLASRNWRQTGLMAVGIFFVGYALPPLMLGRDSSFAGFVQIVATVAAFALTTGAVFSFLRARGKEQDALWVGEISASGEIMPAASRPPESPPVEWTAEQLRALDVESLRKLCVAFYAEKGFLCEALSGAHDGMVLCRSNEPAFTAILGVLPSGIAAADSAGVHELVEARGALGATRSFLIALDGFSERARTLAKGTQVSLIDSKLLLSMLSRLPHEAQLRVRAVSAG